MNIRKMVCLWAFYLMTSTLAWSQSEDKDKFKKIVEEADALLSQREYLKARELYQQALAIKPNDKQIKEKIEDCSTHLKRPYEAMMREADKAFSLGQFAKAIRIYEESLRYFDSEKARTNIEKARNKPSGVFAKSLGGKSYDEGRQIILSQSGHYLITGRTSSKGAGNADLYLVKVSTNGELIWDKTFGGQDEEQGYDLLELSNGDILVVGYSDSYDAEDNPGNKNMYVIRTDASGNKLWEKHFGDLNSIDEGKAIVPANDGGFIVLGNSMNLSPAAGLEPNNDIVVLKIDDKGNKIWQKNFGSAVNDEGNSLIATPEGYVIVGATEAKGNWDLYLLAIDNQGNILWEKIHGGGEKDLGNDIKRDKDGNFVVAGLTYSFATGGSHDFWVLKVNPKGEKIWSKVFGGLSVDEAYSVLVTASGNYVLAGYSEDFERDEYGENISLERLNVFLVQLTPDGNVIWQRAMGGERDQRGFDVIATTDGSFIVVGINKTNTENKEDLLIMKFNAEGMSVQP